MFKINRKVCTNCKLCMLSCTAAHEPGIESPKFARIGIIDAWPAVGKINVCVACPRQLCIKSCPEDALKWDGHVVLDKEKCTRCGECTNVCATGGVSVHKITGYPIVCDTCDGAFSCVNVCPTRAISRR